MISKSKTSVFIVLFTTLLYANSFIDENSSQKLQVSPLFTDPSKYNSYDFGNYPFGLFDNDSFTLKASVGIHTNRLYDSNNNDSLLQRYISYSAPELFIGMPKILFINLDYTPEIISSDFSDLLSSSLLLHTFGLSIAAQIPTEYFKIALKFGGFTGKEKFKSENSNLNSPDVSDSRLILGIEELSLSVGSRIHELVAIGMKGGVSVTLDTLIRPANTSLNPEQIIHDRYFDGEIPQLSWFLDFGNHEFPVESNFLLSTSTSHFIYVAGNNEDYSPIIGKNLAWKSHTAGNISLSSIQIHPSIRLGYWQTTTEYYEPTENNDNLDVGDKQDGQDWKLTNFNFGAGSSFSLHSFLSLWLEYSNASMNLKTGSYWTNNNHTDQYHHTTLGLDIHLHAIPQLHFPSSIETTIKTGYLNRTLNKGLYELSNDKYKRLTTIGSPSQQYRYIPDYSWSTTRITCFSIGLQFGFLDKMFEIESAVNFQNQSITTEKEGLDFTLGLTYNLR